MPADRAAGSSTFTTLSRGVVSTSSSSALTLSSTGIPPLAGFLGKFYLFLAAIGAQPDAASLNDGLYWLVAFALVMSVVSLYYYLRVLKAFLVVSGEDALAKPERAGNAAGFAIAALAVVIVALGLWPEPLLGLLKN